MDFNEFMKVQSFFRLERVEEKVEYLRKENEKAKDEILRKLEKIEEKLR